MDERTKEIKQMILLRRQMIEDLRKNKPAGWEDKVERIKGKIIQLSNELDEKDLIILTAPVNFGKLDFFENK